MYLHVEAFNTLEEATTRYMSISDGMKENPNQDCGIFNLEVEGGTFVVAIMSDMELPYKVLQGSVAGEPYRLSMNIWQALFMHHFQAKKVAPSLNGWVRHNFKEGVFLNPSGTPEDGISFEELYTSGNVISEFQEQEDH